MRDTPGKADLHIHTSYSDGMMEASEVLDHVESQTDLDVIAITEHDDVRGSLAARELWAKGNFRFDFVTGVEVTAIEGHILALYVEEPVPSLVRTEEILEAVHKQGGLCVVAHPMSLFVRSLDRLTMERVAASKKEGVYFDGIETANQSPAMLGRNRMAARLNRVRLRLAETGSSDAHFLKAIGAAYTAFPGRSAAELRQSILDCTTIPVRVRGLSVAEIGVKAIVRQSWRGISATPRVMGWGPTAMSFVRRIFRR